MVTSLMFIIVSVVILCLLFDLAESTRFRFPVAALIRTHDAVHAWRGGAADSLTNDSDQAKDIAAANDEDEAESLSEKVNAAMRRLGIVPEAIDPVESLTMESQSSPQVDSSTLNSISLDETGSVQTECKDGVCTLPLSSAVSTTSNSTQDLYKDKSMEDIVTSIAHELDVDKSIVMAAIGATMKIGEDKNGLNEMNIDAAKQMIILEKHAIESVSEDSIEVQQLLSEGYDLTLSRRALAFTENNVDNARAVLMADEEDEMQEENQRVKEEEERAMQQHEASLKTIRVDANFDPTKLSSIGNDSGKGSPSPSKSITKEDVIFHGKASTLEKLIFESPVPVLLDVYADWCGPCKQLTPILEEITLKAGGLFRLVKLNTDEERTASQALEVTALPTIFAIRDGQILSSFQGFPPNEDFMKQFMMGLLGAGPTFPAPSSEDKRKLEDITTKLMKLAGAATFSFSQREILDRRINERLDDMAASANGDLVDAEEAMRTLRSLLSNIIRFPYDVKYRRVNLENKIIAAKLCIYPSAMAILKCIGFSKDPSNSKNLIVGSGKRYINLTALIIARDSIEKWIDRNRRNIAAAERRRVDEVLRSKLAEDDTHKLEPVTEEDDMTSMKQVTTESDMTNLQIRLEGKKKLYPVKASLDDPLSSILTSVPLVDMDTSNITITCTGKKLIVKSNDSSLMSKSFRDLNLYPSVILVIKAGNNEHQSSASKMKERAELRRNLKRGEHSMHSIGVYAKDDGAKGELIDGGGGVWYEHDVSDDDDANVDR